MWSQIISPNDCGCHNEIVDTIIVLPCRSDAGSYALMAYFLSWCLLPYRIAQDQAYVGGQALVLVSITLDVLMTESILSLDHEIERMYMKGFVGFPPRVLCFFLNIAISKVCEILDIGLSYLLHNWRLIRTCKITNSKVVVKTSGTEVHQALRILPSQKSGIRRLASFQHPTLNGPVMQIAINSQIHKDGGHHAHRARCPIED